jgi:hypothetical protein
VDVIVDPSGSLTTIGLFVLCLLWHGALRLLKWPVVPVSATACVGGGAEPRLFAAFALELTMVVLNPGLPLSYSPPGAAGAPVGLALPRRLDTGTKMNWQPPCMLLIVAALLCPSLG